LQGLRHTLLGNRLKAPLFDIARYTRHFEAALTRIWETWANGQDPAGFAVPPSAAAQPGDDSKITALKAAAQKAIEDGELAKADDLLAAIEKIQTDALDRLALNAAQTTAQRGDVALTRLRYPDAAQRFADAAAKVPQGHEDERWKYLNKEASALYRQGNEFGDNDAARSAIERYRHLALLRPRNAFPSDWAMIENDLGTALWTLGDRSGERDVQTRRGNRCVSRGFEGKNGGTRAARMGRDPEQSGQCACTALGWRESGTARLEEAVPPIVRL
jgi:hypothetical protein